MYYLFEARNGNAIKKLASYITESTPSFHYKVYFIAV
jgi:hypothetical protein